MFPAGTAIDTSSAANGEILATTNDGATALLPADGVIYLLTPTPQPTFTPAAKPPAAHTSTAADLITLSGKVYKNARPFRPEPDGINYAFEGGVVKIPFTDLPDTIRKQYQYDPSKARKFAEEDAAAQQHLAEAQAESELATQRVKETADFLAQNECLMVVKIRQVTDEGALVDASTAYSATKERTKDVSTGLERRYTTESYQETEWAKLDEPVFIYGLETGHVDGDVWEGKVWFVGSKRYTTVLGATKTVRAYTASKEQASHTLSVATH